MLKSICERRIGCNLQQSMEFTVILTNLKVMEWIYPFSFIKKLLGIKNDGNSNNQKDQMLQHPSTLDEFQ